VLQRRDEHRKGQVEGLPKPNKPAHTYYQPKLDEMVAAIELWLKAKTNITGLPLLLN
jgi:hypothetical protein